MAAAPRDTSRACRGSVGLYIRSCVRWLRVGEGDVLGLSIGTCASDAAAHCAPAMRQHMTRAWAIRRRVTPARQSIGTGCMPTRCARARCALGRCADSSCMFETCVNVQMLLFGLRPYTGAPLSRPGASEAAQRSPSRLSNRHPSETSAPVAHRAHGADTCTQAPARQPANGQSDRRRGAAASPWIHGPLHGLSLTSQRPCLRF